MLLADLATQGWEGHSIPAVSIKLDLPYVRVKLEFGSAGGAAHLEARGWQGDEHNVEKGDNSSIILTECQSAHQRSMIISRGRVA
jgi:hypothetical protein